MSDHRDGQLLIQVGYNAMRGSMLLSDIFSDGSGVGRQIGAVSPARVRLQARGDVICLHQPDVSVPEIGQ